MIEPSATFSAAKAYESMVRIRCFEQTVLDEFPRGVFHGTTHTYIGQEANAVGVIGRLRDGDSVFSNHRCHGHFIAYGGDTRALFAEMMGRATGVCGGRGGSQHLHWRNFYSSGVLGNAVPVATGMALAGKLQGLDEVVVTFLGDGALGAGVIYESLNMASLWQAPVLFVVENNGIAQTTPIELAMAGTIPGRFEGFGIPARHLQSSDAALIDAAAHELIDEIRSGSGPRALVLDTHRLAPHSKSDDTRPAELVERLRQSHDPVRILAEQVSEMERQSIEESVAAEIRTAFEAALADPEPDGSVMA